MLLKTVTTCAAFDGIRFQKKLTCGKSRSPVRCLKCIKKDFPPRKLCKYPNRISGATVWPSLSNSKAASLEPNWFLGGRSQSVYSFCECIHDGGSIRESLINEKWIFVRIFQVFFIIQRTCGEKYLMEKWSECFLFPRFVTLQIEEKGA